MERIGLLGGTFNPIHNGHLRLAELMKNELGLDRVVFIPDHIPPHKSEEGVLPDETRLEMLRLAIEDIPYAETDSREIDRGGKSYTFYTLKELTEENPKAKYFFLVGSDMFLSLDRWFKSEEIMKMAHFCGVARTPEDKEALLLKQKEFKEKGFETVVLDEEAIVLSSSEIRERITLGEDVSSLMPHSVWAFIKEKGLYGNN